jgi:hypothetical protein
LKKIIFFYVKKKKKKEKEKTLKESKGKPATRMIMVQAGKRFSPQ